MKANELRIGNFVWDDYSGEMIVFGVIDGGINPRVELRKTATLPAGSYDVANIQPIPLTEEWLVKFGFEDLSEGYWFKGLIQVGYTTTDEFIQYEYLTGVNSSHTEMLDLKYVHQLQNLYFALTGNELTPNA